MRFSIPSTIEYSIEHHCFEEFEQYKTSFMDNEIKLEALFKITMGEYDYIMYQREKSDGKPIILGLEVEPKKIWDKRANWVELSLNWSFDKEKSAYIYTDQNEKFYIKYSSIEICWVVYLNEIDDANIIFTAESKEQASLLVQSYKKELHPQTND